MGTSDGNTPIDQGYDYFIGSDSNLEDYFGWPNIGIEQGVEIDDLMMGLDIFATLAAVGSGSSTQDTLDSQSLYDYLVGNDVADARKTLYTELYSESADVDK